MNWTQTAYETYRQAIYREFSIFVMAFLCLFLSCAAGGQHIRSTEALKPQQEVVALGIAASREVDLAKQKAISRAKKNLVRMLKPQSVAFEFRFFPKHSSLVLIQQTDEVEHVSTDFEKFKGWWVARVKAQRSVEDLAQMRRMVKKSVRASTKVSHPDPSLALMHAEKRAFRQAIEKMIPAKQKTSFLSGKLTVLALDEKLSDSGVQVDLLLHINIIRDRRLTKAEQQELLENVVREYRSLMEWPKAIDALQELLAQAEPTARRYQLLGKMYLYAQQPKQAADAFSSASQLAPNNPDLIRQELDAAMRIPDKQRVFRLQQRLKTIRKKSQQEKRFKNKPVSIP